MGRCVLDLEALLRVPYVEPDSGFTLSPDGTQVAFSWNRSGQWQIYILPLHGSGPPHQTTTGPGAKIAPRWAPDGRCLAYVMDLDGSERYDICIYDLATARHRNLTPDTPNAIQPNFCWSPDSRWIAFASDRSGCFDTYVAPTDGKQRQTGPVPRRVLGLPYPDWEMQWSPDGRWLAVVAETHGQDYGTFIVPALSSDSTPRPIADGADAGHPSPICAKDARWSPDSRHIAFASNRRGHYDIGIYELATGLITWVTDGEGDKEAPAWSADGRRLAYVLSHGPETELAVLELGQACPTTYQVDSGVHYRPRFTPGGAHLAFVFDNPRSPCDLWLLSLRPESQNKALPGRPARQLTHSLPLDLQDASFTMPASVRYPGLDGQSVPALLYQPNRTLEPPPAVVYVHGGPNWLTQVTWDPLVQHMVSRGWVVLAPNYRGSTGHGRDWQLASRFDFGGCDTRDVVAGADYLVREGLADRARIAITGTSWGGYLTMTSLTQYPDRWAAGSAAVPFLNWFTGHANSRADLQHWDLENFGDPEVDYDLYYERSPFFFLDRVAAPVQLICGAHDVRCPASESLQARDALLEQGKRCDLLLYADEGHGFLKTENVVDAKVRRTAFLAEILEATERGSKAYV